MLKAGWLVFPLLPPRRPPPPPPPPPLFLSFTTSKSYLGKKRGFLSLMANSHKFVLNMSSIDWPCRMNTIKETALSASHLGGEDGGIKRGAGWMEEYWEENKEGKWEGGRNGVKE